MAFRSAPLALALLLFGCADRTDSLDEGPRPQPSELSDPKRPDVMRAKDPAGPVLEPVPTDRCEDPASSCALCVSRELDLDFTLRSVEITGAVRLTGRAGLIPARYGWGTEAWMLFTDTRTQHVYRVRLNEQGDYQTHLFRGEYNVEIIASGPQQYPYITLASLGRHNFQNDGVLNHQLYARELYGEITLNGQTMPPDRSDGRVTRGSIVFVDQSSGTQLKVDLPPEGPATYTAVLPTDRAYDVVWRTGGFEDQSPHAADPLPPSAAVISALSSTDTGVVDFDVQTIEISGEVTAAGVALPDDGVLDGVPRAVLEFRSVDYPSVSRLSLGEQGPGRFSVTLVPGDYEVELITAYSTYQDALNSYTRWTPCEGSPGKCTLLNNGTMNFDVPEGVIVGAPPSAPETAVEGQVALLGPWQDLQADLSGAEVVFFPREPGAELRAELLEDGRFTLQLPQGRYDLYLRGRHGRSPWGSATAAAIGSTPLPMTGATQLGSGVLIQGATQTLDLTAEAVHLTGEVLINHELMKTNGQFGERGRLELSVTSDDEAYPRFSKIHLFFGEEGPASWDVLIMRNQYTARLSTFDSSRGIHPMSQDVLPVGELLLESLDLSSIPSLSRDVLFDVGVHSLRGTLRLEGSLPSVEDQELGVLFFHETLEESFLAPLNASEEAFEVLVFAGDYQANLVSGRWDATPPFGATPLLPECVLED